MEAFLKERKVANFEMIEGGPAFVTVRHLSENHRYSFLVARREGKRYLGEVAILEGGLGKHTAEHFSADARAFAERVASKAGLIDESRESPAIHKVGTGATPSGRAFRLLPPPLNMAVPNSQE